MSVTSGGPGRPGGSKARALLASVSLLLIGAAGGIALDRHFSDGSPPAPASARMHDAALAAMSDRLGLDDAQRVQVDSIISTHHEALGRVWASLHARLGATLDTVHEELEAVLTPEQRAEFREWMDEMAHARRH